MVRLAGAIALGMFGANILTTSVNYLLRLRARYLDMRDALKQMQRLLPPQMGGNNKNIKMVGPEEFMKMKLQDSKFKPSSPKGEGMYL